MGGNNLNKGLSFVFQMAAVFIGTIVGAGLASGQEISQFFTSYGYKSFFGIIICCFIYIGAGYMIISLSTKYNLTSYNDLISLVSYSKLFARFTGFVMSCFLISSASIILAGSGALLHQYFHISKWIGTLIMVSIALFTLFRDTKGLIEINSFIVPSLFIVILTIFLLYLFLYRDLVSVPYITSIPYQKKTWLLSCIIYGAFNSMCCSGVLVPLSSEIKAPKRLFIGISIGALGLTVLTYIINLLLMLNTPNIYQYEIPLLYIANRFGSIIQIMLLCIIWLEMFSTEVSDVFSVSKTISKVFGITYKQSVLCIIGLAIPISQIGFANLIRVIFPAFGVISLIFLIQCTIYYFKQ